MQAKENIYGYLLTTGGEKIPVVHLKGHESLHFRIGSMAYDYMHSTEISEEEFMALCRERNWVCDIFHHAAYIRGNHHQVYITADGKVQVDGKDFPVHGNSFLDRCAKKEGRK